MSEPGGLEVVPAGVGGDMREPGFFGGFAAEGVPARIGLEEGFLHGFPGQVHVMEVTETQLQYILFIQKHEAVDLFPAIIFHIGGSLQYSLQSLQLPSTYIDGTAGEKLTGGGNS